MEDDISASLDKGVLTVTLPKAQPAPKHQPKLVAVQAKGAAAAAGEGERVADAARGEPGGKISSAPQGQCIFRPWGRCNNK
jgi:hypothetical protein